MLISYTFSPRTSIYNRKAAIDSAFICPLYRGRVSIIYRVLYVVSLYTFTAFFQRYFYLISTYLAMHIVDLHLYQWPPILYYYSSALLAQRQVSAQYYNSSYISYSLSTTYRRKASQLIGLGTVPFQGGLALIYALLFSISSFLLGSLILQKPFIQPLLLYIRLVAVLLLDVYIELTAIQRASMV